MNLTELIKKTFIYKMYYKRISQKTKERREVRKEYFRKEATILLEQFSLALNQEEIPFWLEFGTLLGYYREHDFIKHDCDLDFGAYLNDAQKVRKALEDVGFKRIVQFRSSDGGFEECYKLNHTTLDVFYFRSEGGNLYCNTFSPCHHTLKDKLSRKKPCFVKKVYIPNNGFKSTEYKGCRIYVPCDIKKHLENHYGKDFMTPNPQFDYKKEATNIIYCKFSEVSGYAVSYGAKE